MIGSLPMILVTDLGYEAKCTSMLLASSDTWQIRPQVTPTVHKLLVFTDIDAKPINISNLRGRRAVFASCNSSDFFVKTEFESDTRLVSGGNLNLSLPGDEISKDRTVLLGTFNCTIFSATGPIRRGKPEWIDGVELNGVISLLDSRGINWSIVPTNGYGIVYPDGTVEAGKLKSVVSKGLVDIGFCDYWINSGSTFGDVLNPWQRSCTRLLVPRPQQMPTAWHTVFKPLPAIFWALVISFSFLSACSITTLSYLGALIPSKGRDIVKITFGDSCFEAVSLLIQGMGDHIRRFYLEKYYRQEDSTEAKLQTLLTVQDNKKINDLYNFVINSLKIRVNRELRLIQVSWALFVVIFGAIYSSSLASILTTPLEEEVPQTLKELLEKGFVWVSGLGVLSNPEYCFKTQSGVDEKWLKLQVSDVSLLGGKTTVLGEEMNGHFFMDKMNFFSEEFLQSLMVSKQCLAANHISIVTRKSSSYFEFMSEGFSRLAETGILNKMLSDGLTSPQINKYIVSINSVLDEIPRGIPLGLGELRGAFYILLFGNTIAFFVFIWETNRFSMTSFSKKLSEPEPTSNPDWRK